MNSHRKVAFSRLFNRHRFENSELECLFRRYILRVQHASITSAVALFVVLTAAMATASFIKVQAPTLSNLYHSLHCGVFVILFIVLCTRSIEDLYLNYVCYTIIFFCTAFCVVALPGKYNSSFSWSVQNIENMQIVICTGCHKKGGSEIICMLPLHLNILTILCISVILTSLYIWFINSQKSELSIKSKNEYVTKYIFYCVFFTWKTAGTKVFDLWYLL